MNTELNMRLEKLLDRKLSVEEKERLRRIQDTLHISAEDALWDILVAMEYQRNYYDELPEKISAAAAEILQGITVAAEREVAHAQSRLAESVVEQAKKLSVRISFADLLPVGLLALACLLAYGSLMLWAGYGLGSGQAQPPAWLLQMPVGVILGLLCCCGLFLGVLAARDFAEGGGNWRKRLLVALGCMVAGGWILGLTVF